MTAIDATAAPVGLDAGDDCDVRLVRHAPPLLAAWNVAGVLAPVDVHTAMTLARLLGEERGEVLLAAALAVRGPRVGHVCVDLAVVRQTVTAQDDTVDVGALPWPEPQAWVAAVAASPLVGPAGEAADVRPLRLDGTRLYLDRYWSYERRVVAALRARAGVTAGGVEEAVLADGLGRLFPEGGRQRDAAAMAVRRTLAIVAGGPGTGKTTTVGAILALLDDQALAAGAPPPRVALTASTGKAAIRLQAAVAGASLLSPAARKRLGPLEATTLHRLLGNRPGSRTRFRHDAAAPLPHDVVITDETSMVSLSLMAKLLDAVRPDARVVLLGDPEQLRSVEAGAVLGDIVGPIRRQDRASAEGLGSLAPHVVVLQRIHRFRSDSGIAALAAAVQSGDADGTVAVLAAGHDDVRWFAQDESAPAAVRELVVDAGTAVYQAAAQGDAMAALAAVDDLRILCAHRRGPAGVAWWNPMVERWLAQAVRGFDATRRWYVGRPVLVTANDPQLGLANGDVGVVVAGQDGRPLVAFSAEAPQAEPRLLSPHRLDAIDTVHAMTVHKSQGSQFRRVVTVLPRPQSRILTRELLYTAVTRAQDALVVVGSEESVRVAVERLLPRPSGLRRAFWGDADRSPATAV